MYTPTLMPVGQALLGRVIDANGQPIDGGAPLDSLSHRPLTRSTGSKPASRPDRLLETGIKAVDLYAPIARGGITTLIAGAGLGKLVLIDEIAQHMIAREQACVVIGITEDQIMLKEFVASLEGAGIRQHIALIAASSDDASEQLQRTGQLALTIAEDLYLQGREVLVYLDEAVLSTETIDIFRVIAHDTTKHTMTLLVGQHTMVESDDDLPQSKLLNDRDGQVVFSKLLAKQHIWPAIDPIRSGSRLLDEQLVDPEHIRVAQEAKDLLQQHGGLSGAPDGGASIDQRLAARARRLLRFQTQPFVVSEPYTARPGRYVPIEQTLQGFAALLAGNYDDASEESLYFLGALDQA